MPSEYKKKKRWNIIHCLLVFFGRRRFFLIFIPSRNRACLLSARGGAHASGTYQPNTPTNHDEHKPRQEKSLSLGIPYLDQFLGGRLKMGHHHQNKSGLTWNVYPVGRILPVTLGKFSEGFHIAGTLVTCKLPFAGGDINQRGEGGDPEPFPKHPVFRHVDLRDVDLYLPSRELL